MPQVIPVQRWLNPAILIEVAAVAMIGIRTTGANSPRVSGGVIFISLGLLFMIVKFYGRAERRTLSHQLAYGALPVTLAVLLVTLDVQYVLEHGIVVNSAAIATVIVAFAMRLHT